ncbi:MAG: chemotaxis response regulator protein-glutamate methylesterase [Desulfuromonadales bacterium]|uniref:protein-glutamate methylesterase/protein-glutamine glutaminase n=1 Tax=Desulfuromonas sp. KJ2020 TaxID=2919173 RepID=UPI0020A70245|nr:chemotaxis response regulator protein-glutamate methylesterase [Desulfuromonas sp. KJ2020]MCP3177650.1 chemotaxis response regulator protein-glutamate methylesterase [Desulfuromonas sp. KJ2020]
MNNQPVRVLVVDDSAYNRRAITKMLEDLPGVKVVGYACDGEEGLRKVFDLKPDLVTLDLEMPRMDGFSFLRIIMQNRPTPVIVVSARTDDENVFKALDFGAVDFVSKPTARISTELLSIKEDLHRKVRAVVLTDMRKVLRRPLGQGNRPVPEEAPIRHRRRNAGSPSLTQIVIGASTGGPPALQAILSQINEKIPVGIAISQHMPAGFTHAFAERLNKVCALEVSEAQTGDVMEPGRVLIAPGGRNLTFVEDAGRILAHARDPGADQRYVPSVDVMFESAARVYGPNLLAVVLTGMGNDGAKGVVSVKEVGGQALAEAEESSVVFGMPKEAIATGRVDKVVPLPLLCTEILRRCGL